MIDAARIRSVKTAVDNMDDYAKMSASIDPAGARTVLEMFVADVETTVPELVASLKELMVAFENSIPDHCNADAYEEYNRAAAVILKTTGETPWMIKFPKL